MAYKFLFLTVIASLSFTSLAQTPEPQAGDTRTDAFGIEQVYVPPGCFKMGASDEEVAYALSLDGVPSWGKQAIKNEQPQHDVCLTQGYWIDRYEVTNSAFQAFVDDGGYTNEALWSEKGLAWLAKQPLATLPIACDTSDLPDHPRVCVTWYETEAYATWRGGRLPTEAEWEFAARGEDSFAYPWGNVWDATLANVVNGTATMPVGSFPEGASWVGAQDMAGNAMEWVMDWLAKHPKDAQSDPTGPEKGSKKVEKGGWWGSNPLVARSSYRHFEDPPTYQDHHIGFRMVSPLVSS